MQKNGKQVHAGLRGHGEWGRECQFLYDGELAVAVGFGVRRCLQW
jgi:hypothetical protein